MEFSIKMPGSSFYVLLFLLCTNAGHAQYLHVQGKQIVDKDNQEFILRGMGLGGWMLQEGYMLETSSFAGPQHQIRARIKDLIGEANTQEFYTAWLANHCRRSDIDSLKSWGFNSVRLPMHYNLFTLPIEAEPVAGQQTWLDKGFLMVDSLLQWCGDNQIYLILDLHATPGGQGNDAAISDYDASKPSLWQSEANKQKTIALWRRLADRYKNEPWIGGYDMINEPNWNFTGTNKNGCDETNNAPLKQLLQAITNAIREVDKNHILFLGGNCWGNNYNGILPPWDNNTVISFHKYWNYNDPGSIQFALNMREQYQVPVWLGESGENSNVWFTNAIRLMEDNKIGWAWWPEKKVGSVVNPLTIPRNQGYAALLQYWKNGGSKPSVEVAKAALMQLAEDLKIEHCTYHRDVIDAMFRQVRDYTSLPYKKHTAPGIVHAVDYDLGRNAVAYSDTDTANYQVSSSYSAWNSGYSYRNDGVDIEASTDTAPQAPAYQVGWTADGEWLQYTVEVDSSAVYDIGLRYAAFQGNAQVSISVQGALVVAPTALPSTGSFLVWKEQVFENVPLYKGRQQIRLIIDQAGANINSLSFSLKKKLNEVALQAVSAQTNVDGTLIYAYFNKQIDPSGLAGDSGFSLTANGASIPLSNISPDPDNPAKLILESSQELSDQDILLLHYQGAAVSSVDGTSLTPFVNLPVQNTLPFHFLIPTQIEAEAFVVNQGLQTETTTDAGGGQNIGYTNAGDYVEYRIRVPQSGLYPVQVRAACSNQAGKIEIQQLDATGTDILHSVQVNIPVTGGWQNWKTLESQMELQAGKSRLRVLIIQPEFNLNWYRFLSPVWLSTQEEKAPGRLQLFPNPAGEQVQIVLPEATGLLSAQLRLFDLYGRELDRKSTLEGNGPIRTYWTGDLPGGVYLLEYRAGGKRWLGKLIK